MVQNNTRKMVTKLRAAHKLSKLDPEGKVTRARAIVSNIKASPYFDLTKTPIPLDSADLSLNDLSNAITAAENKAPGSVSHMHEMERVVLSVFNLIKSYVEVAANASTDPKSVIESAGLIAIARSNNGPVTDLTVTALGNGVVEIEVPRAKGEAAFIYQYSADGGVTWVEFEHSKLATVQLTRQTPASTLLFRFAAIGKTKGSFSQAKSAIVL
jgi:hypothetical protein